MKKVQKQEKQIQKILSELSEIQTKYTDEEIANILTNVMQELQCIVQYRVQKDTQKVLGKRSKQCKESKANNRRLGWCLSKDYLTAA